MFEFFQFTICKISNGCDSRTFQMARGNSWKKHDFLIEFFCNYFFPAKCWQIWSEVGSISDFIFKSTAGNFF